MSFMGLTIWRYIHLGSDSIKKYLHGYSFCIFSSQSSQVGVLSPGVRKSLIGRALYFLSSDHPNSKGVGSLNIFHRVMRGMSLSFACEIHINYGVGQHENIICEIEMSRGAKLWDRMRVRRIGRDTIQCLLHSSRWRTCPIAWYSWRVESRSCIDKLITNGSAIASDDSA